MAGQPLYQVPLAALVEQTYPPQNAMALVNTTTHLPTNQNQPETKDDEQLNEMDQETPLAKPNWVL